MIAFADADQYRPSFGPPVVRGGFDLVGSEHPGLATGLLGAMLAGLRVILSHAMPYGQLMTCTLDSRRDTFVTVRGIATGQIYRMGDDRVLMHPETLKELRRRIGDGG